MHIVAHFRIVKNDLWVCNMLTDSYLDIRSFPILLYKAPCFKFRQLDFPIQCLSKFQIIAILRNIFINWTSRMKASQKDTISFAVAAFIIWIIVEVVIDLITGVTITEIMTLKYIVGYILGAIGFAILFTLFQIWRNNRKK